MSIKIGAIRLIPILLVLFLFISNLYLGIIAYPYSYFIKYLIFGAVYLVLAFILISKIKFAELIGMIITIAILFVYPAVMEFKNLHPWSSGLLSALNAIVIISCFLLMMLKIKD
jgi:hypothetical protein